MKEKDRAGHGQKSSQCWRQAPGYLECGDEDLSKGDAGVWKGLPGWDVEQNLTKGREQPLGSWSLGEGMKCHSVYVMSLLSVAREHHWAVGSMGQSGPRLLLTAEPQPPVLQTSGSLSWNPNS